MKIDFSQQLKTISGEPMYEDSSKEKPALLKTICVNALLGIFDDDGKLTGEDKLLRYQLADRIYGGGAQDTSVEELALLKKLVAKAYPALICGQVMLMLEGRSNG